MGRRFRGISPTELAHVVDELRELQGQRIAGVWQPRRDALFIGFMSGATVLLEAGGVARCHPVPRRPRNPRAPFSFQGLLRARLTGSLTAVEQVPGERIVVWHFGDRALHHRMIPGHAGMWLVDDGVAVGSAAGPCPPELPALPSTPLEPAPPRFEPQEGETWGEAAARYLGREERVVRAEELARVLSRHLRTAQAKDKRLLRAMTGDLERALDTDALRRRADSLAASLHSIRRGSTEAVVPDAWHPGEEQRIALDPAKPPSATLQKLYAKAGRLERAAESIAARLGAVEARVETRAEALEAVDGADLRALEKSAKKWKLPRAGAAVVRPAPSHIETWQEESTGRRILAGRTERGNRRLTFQIARAQDVWMHLKGRPGAHILVPVPRGQTASLDLLLLAAQVVLAKAKIPRGETADVQYAQKRHLRSVAGGGPSGKVLVDQEKVLHVARDPDALDGWTRLLT